MCKLLPGPFDLVLRRSKSKILKNIFKQRYENYELKNAGYNDIMDVPHLSGCFMFIRRNVLEEVGLFDERFFMYMEDVDLSRRIHKYFRTVYWPEVTVYHKCARDSYVSIDAFNYHVFSAFKYFNKWGWFFDRERKKVNKKTVKECSKKIL